ncbi:hypothetical protein D3875_15950 [Deinococcus cavernae]|uniref:Zn-finger containing protein n=1 Tax=Deinococcus cavernae TaxID=2320857 RepID=A0A418V9L6_9DEIO|nr:hypothetical protein [Deinococcus cavernae]RJF72814.1 hypothetical protein D3875_15950 [Deinococcus cavernae]
MLFPTTCPNCLCENRAEFTDSSIHELTCPNCKARYCVFVRKQKFEMLFDLGTRALLDGYAREAVASFAAALERFFEFYVRAFALERAAQRGEEFGEALGTLNATWRHVVSQSERQVGMFALAYLLREGKEPEFLSGKALGTDFRNKVIHRGYIPGHAEVEEYAARIFALIDRLLSELGDTAQHAELAQEQLFANHLAALPDSVTAIFEEHPGMFRARRFGQEHLAKSRPSPANVRGPNVGGSAAPLNDAQAFQQALRERSQGLRHFKFK